MSIIWKAKALFLWQQIFQVFSKYFRCFFSKFITVFENCLPSYYTVMVKIWSSFPVHWATTEVFSNGFGFSDVLMAHIFQFTSHMKTHTQCSRWPCLWEVMQNAEAKWIERVSGGIAKILTCLPCLPFTA